VLPDNFRDGSAAASFRRQILRYRNLVLRQSVNVPVKIVIAAALNSGRVFCIQKLARPWKGNDMSAHRQ
jgi:hypothetical protein